MKKITDNPLVSVESAVMVSFSDRVEFFGSLKAIYAVHSLAEIGRPVEYLYKQHIDIGAPYDTGKCVISKINIIRLKQKAK